MPSTAGVDRRAARFLATAILACACVLTGDVPARAQLTNPLVQRWAAARVRGEEIRFELQMQQITAAEAKTRTDLMNAELGAIRTVLNALPRPVQVDITQQTETLFQTRIVPLREQWNQQLAQKRQADQARFQQLSKDLQTDAEQSGKLQAERTLAAERAQRGEIPQGEASRLDREAEQQVLAIRRKYDALDVERRNLGYGPYWATAFSRAEAGYTARAVAEGRLRLRLEDTQSEVGKDAHRAADLTFSMQRNLVFQRLRGMTPQETQSLNATAQALLTSLQQKYGPTSPASADFKDRVNRLVQAGTAAQRVQWEKDAIAARDALAAQQAAAARAAADERAAAERAAAERAAAERAAAERVRTAAPTASPAGAPSTPAGSTSAAPRRAPTAMPRPRTNTPATEARVDPPVVVGTTIAPAFPDLPWTPVALILLLVGGAGTGVYFYRGRRTLAPPRYKDVAQSYTLPPTATAPAVSTAPAAVAVDVGPGASLKDRLFAEQRAKYQARYNDAQDEVTAASMALTQLTPILSATHENVSLMARALQSRVQALVVARSGGMLTLVRNAALFMPVWRLFKGGGVLLKIGIVVGLYYLSNLFYRLLTEVGIPQAAVLYLLVAIGCFFVERHLQLRLPLSMLKRHAGEFGNVRVSYIYKDQRAELRKAQLVLQGVRVFSSDKTPAPHEDVFEQSQGVGSFLVTVGTLATYRMDVNGGVSLLSAAQNEFTFQHGSLLTEAMGEHAAFAGATLPAFAEYGQALWRKRRAANLIPELEKLVKDVERIQKVWEDTYVSDPVIEFLFRAMDLFNMRDPATPPGLLLHGLAGNGKKHLAQKIAETLSAEFRPLRPSDVKFADEMRALWQGGGETHPVVLLVPGAESDSFFPRREGGASGEVAIEWVSEWRKHQPHQSRVWIVMTARSDEALDQAILDHVGQDSRVEVGPPDGPGRSMVLRLACREFGVTTAPPEALLRSVAGSSVQDLRRIVRNAKGFAKSNQPQDAHWQQAVQTVRGAAAKFKKPDKTWDRLVLPAKVKEQIQVACKILQDADEYRKKGVPVPNILLYGPPGTGKTEVAVTIANEAGVNFMPQRLSDLKGKHIGVSGQNVKEMFDKARAQAPTVLFIDEIDGVMKTRGAEGTDQYTDEIVFEFLQQTEGAEKSDRAVIILGATNHLEVLDPAVLRRFQRRIEIPLPDEDGRRQIFKGLLTGKPLEPGVDVDELCDVVAKRSNGQSGAALRNAVDSAMNNAVSAAGAASVLVLTRAAILEAVDELVALASDQVDPTARWSTLVVSDDTTMQLKELSDALRHMETLQRQGIEPAKGGLLYGPPGTGKTRIAQTLANESGVPFLSKTGADLGQSAASVRAVFENARSKAPCILFLDEFEKAGQSRDQGGSTDVVLEILQQMDGAKKNTRPVFVLAATNYKDRLDDAILSRFRYQIEVPNPTREQREKLFAIVLKKYPTSGMDVAAVAAELATIGGGLSGRDITNVVGGASQAAVQRAIRAGTTDHVVMTREDLVTEVTDAIKRSSTPVDPGARWDTLVLSDDTMKKLRQISAAVRSIEERRKQGLEPPGGAVLFGPPGTGKTQIARTIANESQVQFLSATVAELTGRYIGESTQKVAKLFADARKKAPCILFLDEFDGATAARGSDEARNSFAGEVVGQILAEMEGVKATGRAVFVLAATNHLENVDPAVRSRFDYKLEIPLPTLEQRERLFAIALGKVKRVDFDVKEMAAELASRAGEISGRDIVKLVGQAARAAAQRADDAGTPAVIVLTRPDLLSLLGPAGREVAQEDVETVWSQIVLKPAVKESLIGMVRLFNSGSKASPKGLLLHGPSGTGKTEVARLLARSTGCEFLEASMSVVKGTSPGESARKVKAIWDRARVHGRAVIFVDECDGIFARRGGMNTDAAVEEVTNAFLPLWDGVSSGGQIWVVGATNKRDRLDEAIEQRFGESIEIGLPDAAERQAILELELRKLESALPVPEFVGKATSGLSGRNLSKVAATIYRQAAQRGGAATDETWRNVIRQFGTTTADPVDPGATWDSLILPEATLKRLKRIAQMLRHAESLREQGIEPPRAALLFGPPGTGKTQIAKTLANESGLNFIAAGPSDIKGGYIGQSGLKVRELFERARAKPAILFIDEIDAGAGHRGGESGVINDEIVTELLAQMEGVKKVTGTLFVLAATNHPEHVDAAVLSRFEDRIEIANPGPAERVRMLKSFIGRRRVDFDVDRVAEELAFVSDGLSGRDLMSAVRRASQLAVERALDAGTPDQIALSREDLVSQFAGRASGQGEEAAS